MNTKNEICVFIGEGLKQYGFGHGHPFGPDRMEAFWSYAKQQGLEDKVNILEPVQGKRSDMELFHTTDYINRVIAQSRTGHGMLDYGDTPAFPGVFEAASYVVGTTLNACDRLMQSDCKRAFTPIGGLHHARRDSAGGFCVFNDPAIAIMHLRKQYNLQRIAYVDIDAHHGDGVFYGFEDDPSVYIVDFHEDGRFLYPGTGFADEIGSGRAKGTKLNIPLMPGANDEDFFAAWPQVEAFLIQARPGFILFQCGADSLAGDPITHLQLSVDAHRHATRQLCRLADEYCEGHILAMGGGGYNRQNLAVAWTAVVETLISSD